MIKTEEKLIQIARRVPPGDRWQLDGDNIIQKSLTEALEAYFQKTGKAADYRLSPISGKLYVITTEEIEIKPEPPKQFSIYGDYEV